MTDGQVSSTDAGISRLVGIDVATDTSGHAHELLAAGVQAVGIYLRPDRCSPSMVRGLRSVGIRLWSCYERGSAEDPAFYTGQRGREQAACASTFARKIGQPSGTAIFAAVDCDAEFAAVESYLAAFHLEMRSAGYLAGIYGSGQICSQAIGAGYAHFGWLAQSCGWNGHAGFQPRAAIVQRDSTSLCGFDVDMDDVLNDGVLWG